MTTVATAAEIDAYIARLNAVGAERHASRGNHGPAPTFAIDPGGKKFLRVVETFNGGRSAWAFVEVATGDVYKPAGWKGPERNFSRGNIRNLDNVAYRYI